MKIKSKKFLIGLVFISLGIVIGYSLAFLPVRANFLHQTHMLMNEESCPLHEMMEGSDSEEISVMSVDEQREVFMNQKDEMISQMIEEGDYACCLQHPCVSCISNTKSHGDGATCTCLEDVINGVHPCGECVGGILGGRGNRFLAKYFAKSISDGSGGSYYEELKKIISEKYSISAAEQI